MRAFPIWDIRYEDEYGAVVDALLEIRGITLRQLTVGPEVMHAPELLLDMDRAVERLERAIRGRERIVVFGDYDVDGVTSTALLLDFLERVGAEADYLLPDRHADGYGLKPSTVEQVRTQGPALIVTVDNGISAFPALELAAAGGVDVVVIDHHHQLDELPPATAIVDPNRRESTYPFPGLAGVGVTFKVVQALSERFLHGEQRRTYLNSLLDLVALGTVADVMPVLDENRLFIQAGLRVINRRKRVGLRQLLAAAGYRDRELDATGVAFHLGPRLNVAGRLEQADLALQLLRCQDDHEAAALAHDLNRLNTRRQSLQRAGVVEAEALVSGADLDSERMILLLGDAWHLGVIGLLASRLAEKHARPAVICTAQRRDGTYTGSARSIPGYDISAGVSSCADLLLSHGGHPGAAGFSLAEGNFEAFRVRLLEHAATHLTDADLRPRLELDLLLRPGDVCQETLLSLGQLEPFGPGNPQPLFAARGCHVVGARAVGRAADHLKLQLRYGGSSCSAVWWNHGELTRHLPVGARVDVAFALQADTYSGPGAVQMVVRDMFLA